MRKTLVAAALAAACGAAYGSPATVGVEPTTARTGVSAVETYLIQFKEPGLLYNTGQIAGRAATAPSATGTRKLDASTPAAAQYLAFLRARQDAQLAAISAALGRAVDATYRYEVTFNGIGLPLSAADAETVAALAGVESVRPAGTYPLAGDGQAFFIRANEIWSGAAAPIGTSSEVLRGQGVVIGIIDSGVNSSHPSFAAMGASCDYASSTPKLVQVRNCVGDANCTAGPAGQDQDGHGSHVAASVAGNLVGAGSIGGTLPAVGVSGVAPCAQLISYRVCDATGCSGAAITAAFQRAILDQVDILNFSIAGGTNPWVDQDRLKLDAVNADIFVAAAAGNVGPQAPGATGAVNHRGPWVMTVANGTDDRPDQGENVALTLSVASPAPPPALVGPTRGFGFGASTSAQNNRPVRTSNTNPLGCTANGGFPANFYTGAIAVIQAGTCTVAEKLNNAQAAGAVAAIIVNNTAGLPAFDPGAASLPGIGLEQAAGEALRNFVIANGATPTLINAAIGPARSGGVLNAASLRGPNNGFDVTKPDITGPGTRVYDAFLAPQLFASLTGTSVSSAHVAGGAALVRAVRPTWTPMEVRSALMMTADRSQWLPGAVDTATPDDVGTGMIDLSKAALAGFVMNETFARFVAANPASGGNPRTLNLASLRNSNCVDRCVFNRSIRNTVTAPTSWTAAVTAPVGYSIQPIPSFTFNGTTTETQNIRVIVDMTENTTLTAPQFAEIRFTEANNLSPPLVWTVAIRGTGAAGLKDVLFKDSLENVE